MKKQITLLFVMVASIFSGPLRAQTLGDIDFNFWGIDGSSNKLDPANGVLTWNAAIPSQNNALYISITTLPSSTLGSESTFSGVGCLTGEYAGTKQKGAKPLSNDSVPTGCQLSFNLGMGLSSEGQYTASYDTLKNFVQTCPTNINAPGAFQIMSTDVQYGGAGVAPVGCEDFRSWLLSALAWNVGNADYFCADVHAIPAACGSPEDTSYEQGNMLMNEGMSVLYWILHNPICTNGPDSQTYALGRGSQIRTWLDTQDTDSVKLDTTIYTMQQLGLDSVLKYAGLLGVSNNTPSIITNATAYPNPAGEGTVISFGITREAYVSVNLFNVLGHQVENAGFGGVVEPGNLSVPMSLQGLPSGTYFARIVTTFGEVQSVKIVKE